MNKVQKLKQAISLSKERRGKTDYIRVTYSHGERTRSVKLREAQRISTERGEQNGAEAEEDELQGANQLLSCTRQVFSTRTILIERARNIQFNEDRGKEGRKEGKFPFTDVRILILSLILLFFLSLRACSFVL